MVTFAEKMSVFTALVKGVFDAPEVRDQAYDLDIDNQIALDQLLVACDDTTSLSTSAHEIYAAMAKLAKTGLVLSGAQTTQDYLRTSVQILMESAGNEKTSIDAVFFVVSLSGNAAIMRDIISKSSVAA